jgi:polysaccharide biosynthesis/export protein
VGRRSATPYPNVVTDIAEDVRRYAPEINWDYAIIQRVNPVDLSSKLVWMSPRKAIIEKDEASNLELQPGDIVTIFSQRDISVPQADRSQYVIVEGEVNRPGVYKLEDNETLQSVLRRAGGLTPPYPALPAKSLTGRETENESETENHGHRQWGES